MHKLACWRMKNDWSYCHNVYATHLRALKTGKPDWSSDLDIDRDMLPNRLPVPRDELHPKTSGMKVCDTWFCAAFQKGECTSDSPHMARIGPEGIERQVLHICSLCLLKD